MSHNKPLAGIDDAKSAAKGFVAKDEYKKKKELDEARKVTCLFVIDACYVPFRFVSFFFFSYISKGWNCSC
jgi:hypothetical protein